MMRAASGIRSPAETVGVAAAVPALVACADRRREMSEGLDARHEVAADGGVAAHHDPLLARSAGRA